MCLTRAVGHGRGGGFRRNLGENAISGTVPASFSALIALTALCAAPRRPAGCCAVRCDGQASARIRTHALRGSVVACAV